ncbi:MAG: hypothetical protein AAF721_11600 [Myxococcota bacterium]
MFSFSQFYQQGGGFMHFVTLTAIVCLVSVARRTVRLRRTIHAPQGASPLDGGVTAWFLAAGVMLGVLGTLFGVVEMFAALQTVKPDQAFAALLRGGQIVGNPMIWALMCLIPVVFANAVLRHYELRVGRALNSPRP